MTLVASANLVSRASGAAGRVAVCDSARRAKLFAAAPELLAALRMGVARIEIANREGDPILSAWLVDAKAAIAKAQG